MHEHEARTAPVLSLRPSRRAGRIGHGRRRTVEALSSRGPTPEPGGPRATAGDARPERHTNPLDTAHYTLHTATIDDCGTP
eukprot:scaffold266372_cov33-Tisochrysis_lutea.AAC.3